MHLVLIDGTAFLHRAWHTVPKDMVRRSDNAPIGAINLFCSMVWRMLWKHQSATHYAIVGDAKGAPTHRHRLYPLYKANRGPAEDGLKAQLAMMEEAVEAFELPFIAVKGVEADDIIASYADYHGLMGSGNLVTIVSADKDLMQLVCGNVVIFNPNDDMFMYEKQVEEKFGVKPRQLGDYLAMLGDDSDNIPGLKGIGPKYAASYLQQFESIEGIYEHIERLPKRHQAVFWQPGLEGFVRSYDLERSRRLVALKKDLKLPVLARFPLRGRDWTRLAKFCRSNGLESLARRVEDDWHQ